MGLFGFFATMFTGGVLLTDTIKDGALDNESKSRARENNSDTWINSHGDTHLTSTGEKVFWHGYKLKSVKDGRVIVDYRAEQIKEMNKKSIEEAKINGKKYAWLSYLEFNGKLYYTELSTMKRYYLVMYGYAIQATYKKVYYAPGRKLAKIWDKDPVEETINITRDEYIELGGTIGFDNYKAIGKYV